MFVVCGITGPGREVVDILRSTGRTAVVLVCDENVNFMPRTMWDELGQRAALIPIGPIADAESNLDAVVADLEQVAGGIDGVLTTYHVTAHLSALLADRLGVPGPHPRAMADALQKDCVRKRLDEAGLPNLRWHSVPLHSCHPSFGADLEYPVAVKPTDGYGKLGAAIIHGPDEFAAHIAEYRRDRKEWLSEGGIRSSIGERMIIEEVAVGDLYSVEVAADASTTTSLVAVRRKTGLANPVLELGSTMPGTDNGAQLAELLAYARDVCVALELTSSVFHIEVMVTADGPRLIEVNPRIVGSAIPDLVRTATGQSLFEVLVSVASGMGVPATPWGCAQAVSHSYLAAEAASVVNPDLDDNWFAKYRPRLHSGWCTATSGQRLDPMRGNFDPFGLVRVTAATAAAAEHACTELVNEIEREILVPLVRSRAGTAASR